MFTVRKTVRIIELLFEVIDEIEVVLKIINDKSRRSYIIVYSYYNIKLIDPFKHKIKT
jgi:hypothetical protein